MSQPRPRTAAYIEYDREDLSDGKVTPKFKKLAAEGIELDVQIKALKKRQDEIKAALKEEYGTEEKYTIVVPGVGTVPVVPKEELVIADANRLKEVFDKEFDHNVDTKVSFKALPPLVELARDESRPTHGLITEAVTWKQSCALSFKAEK